MRKSRNEKSRKADATKNQFELGPGDPYYCTANLATQAKCELFFPIPNSKHWMVKTSFCCCYYWNYEIQKKGIYRGYMIVAGKHR